MKIKNNIIALSTILIMMFTPTVMAGQVGSMTTFTSGTAAVASEVNGNFTAVETAVNDNDTRTTTNASDISTNQSRLTNIETSTASVHATSFIVPSNESCTVSNGDFLSITAGTSCNAFTGIQIPDARQITEFSCSIFDNDATAGAHIFVRISRVYKASGSVTALFETPVSAQNASIQERTSNTVFLAGTDVVDNSAYYYRLEALFGSATSGADTKLYGCSVKYTTI